MPETSIFNTSFTSDLDESARVQNEIVAELEQRGVSMGDLADLHLALEEGLANAVKHGNKLDSSKQVHVECELSEAGFFSIVIQDEGEGFDPNDVPDCTLPENLDKPSGRGLMLMRAFMDDICYNDVGNQLTITKTCTIE